MPFYEYECPSCSMHVMEQFRMGEAPKSLKCECGEKALRVFSSNFVLKGPGDHWPTQQLRRKNEMTKRNLAAGKRGRGKWKERMPKLVYR